MKRLYAVKVSAFYVVAADDLEHAKTVAKHSIRDFIDWEPDKIESRVMHEIDDVNKLPVGWDDEALPYGNKTPETCGEILDALRTRCNVRVQEVE